MTPRPPPVKSSAIMFLAALTLAAPNMTPWVALVMAAIALIVGAVLMMLGE